MKGATDARRQLLELSDLARSAADQLAEPVARLAALVESALRDGHTLFFCGNGGSAADAQHLAAEYVVRFRRKRRALAAVALTVDTSILTAGANDFGFTSVFARQIEALGRPGDVLFLHSTSGESENLLAAADAARARGLIAVGFLARGGGRLRDAVDVSVVVPTTVTARAQEIHVTLGHVICDLVEGALADPTEDEEDEEDE
jgi:D-sedoheptulose 7-phosphate isomerase